ncbi:BREX-2 system adenine-specific DNA-methyltransferase PglX [Streptomyces sp.]|uniref:BREX-2 system adenine-specific DNA-methyltransferase PglX n=1 Tax=Streptomyces sp. TaxID=1931 RepID=UPI002D794B7B|nr:BREX-2 system adenine-specific DNA-methyltransferase PglX [Streptomyces sp.]HET6356262.1 BREX-2 system adenine-specific DNA-methyltransferase PglX [Streptomyces sp.]
MIDRKSKALLTDLIKQVKAVEVDLGQQVRDGETVLKPLRTEYGKLQKADPKGSPKWEAWLEERLAELPEDRAARVRATGKLWVEHQEAFKLGRTNDPWASWLYGTPQVSGRVTQVAVAWVLGTVFVRFCEDNRLIPEPYLTGPDAERRDLAEARYRQYVEEEQDPTYRGWLELAFEELGSGQAGKLLFDKRRNPLYQIPVSHDGARALVEFWRERREDGELVHDFTDPLNEDGTEGWDTRFLGDLYQDLSEAARKTYALLQTPEFVEEFILDRTMDPMVRELGGRFGELKMIDPTCGSGHFVLGTFRRMVRLWAEREPGRDVHERVRNALNSVHGVDINPFAVAIARFRLLIAAMAAADVRTLAKAGQYDWPIHLAVGDSLIKARQLELTLMGEESGDPLAEFAYATEDVHEHPGILEQGRYDVVVGNPPYITVKDKKLNALYRELYKSCARQYALSVPFAERFFQLARRADGSGRSSGIVGQITSNSFMKREFGRPLIETYFGHKVELTEVIDTSGAYIPGHSTPTVILVGRPTTSSQRSETVRTVLGVQGEPSTPEDAAEGVVWRAITDQIDVPGSESNWVTSVDAPRDRFAHFPWSLSGGSSAEVFQHINEVSDRTLSSVVRLIGRYTHTGSDDSYFAPLGTWRRHGVAAAKIVPLVSGEAVRDWSESTATESLFPYSEKLTPSLDKELHRLLWVHYSLLKNRREPGGTHEEIGLTWYEWSRWHPERYSVPLGIAFPFVATHNHFYLDRGGKVFNRHAPVIKLREGANEEEYLQLLGLLNSSTACFWLKQVSHSKGNATASSGMPDQPWSWNYEFTGTKLEEFPLPSTQSSTLATALDRLAQELAHTNPATLISAAGPSTSATLRDARTRWESICARMIALQEELDWQTYSIYNLHSEDLSLPEGEVPGLAPGERAFEIVLARKIRDGKITTKWFTHHRHTPITEIPSHWPDTYKAVVEKRIAAIESSRAIDMVERTDYKRRWATEGWEALQEKALRSWLLDRMEAHELWFQDGQPTLLTRAQLTSALSLDEDFVSVAELYAPRKELATVVADLLANEHVPFLAALRYKPTGLRKRADWEHVWDLQRQEDAAPDEPSKRKIRDSIPVPPKYTSADFLKPSYWRARGKLDVPKERFISYATGTISGTPDLFGWAGWDHREQAQALSTYFTNHDELSDEQMTPLLAGLLELQPWLTQWHDEFDALYGGSPAAFFAGYRATKQGEHGLTDDDLRAWRPGKSTKG